MTVYEKKVEKKVEIHTVSRFSKNTLLNLKPGLKDFSLNKFQKLVISMFPQVFKTQNFIQFQLISSEWCELYPKNTRIELINTKSSHH